MRGAPGNVLDDPRAVGELERDTGCGDVVGVLALHDPLSVGEGLAGWRPVESVKLAPVLQEVLERIALVELERVVRLRVDVHANHLEPGPVVTHRSATSAAEEI